MNIKKIYVVGNAKMYSKWINNHTLVDNIEEADIVLFTGGEDVDPSLYGCEKHYTTYSNINRDLYEREIFQQVKSNQLCLGICRGSQFLCVMNGGRLIQNVNNHTTIGTHPIAGRRGGCTYEITSTHHQMQYPFLLPKENYEILYHAGNRSDCYEGDGVSYPPCDPEVVLYTTPELPRCLAIQGHPEMMRKEAPVITMLNQLIDELCSEDIQ